MLIDLINLIKFYQTQTDLPNFDFNKWIKLSQVPRFAPQIKYWSLVSGYWQLVAGYP